MYVNSYAIKKSFCFFFDPCRMAHSRSASLEYVTFTGQAQLFNRMLTADIRDALGYEPCERCRLKGGRCARCKALRTGGGYIILDTTDLPEEDNKLRRFGRCESADMCCSVCRIAHISEQGGSS